MNTQTTSPHRVPDLPRSARRSLPRSRAVVAVILQDGTIQSLGHRVRSRQSVGNHGWSTGSLSGAEWILWWERRQLA